MDHPYWWATRVVLVLGVIVALTNLLMGLRSGQRFSVVLSLFLLVFDVAFFVYISL